jgi:hypothetical protein
VCRERKIVLRARRIIVHATAFIVHPKEFIVRATEFVLHARTTILHARRRMLHARRIMVHSKRLVFVATGLAAIAMDIAAIDVRIVPLSADFAPVAMAFVRAATAGAPVGIGAMSIPTRADRIAIAFVRVAAGSPADETSVVRFRLSRPHRPPRSIRGRDGALDPPAQGRSRTQDIRFRPMDAAASPPGSNASTKGLAAGRDGSRCKRGGRVSTRAWTRLVMLRSRAHGEGTATIVVNLRVVPKACSDHMFFFQETASLLPQ